MEIQLGKWKFDKIYNYLKILGSKRFKEIKNAVQREIRKFNLSKKMQRKSKKASRPKQLSDD